MGFPAGRAHLTHALPIRKGFHRTQQLPAALQSQQSRSTLRLCLWLIQGESALREHSSEYSSTRGREPLTRDTSHKIRWVSSLHPAACLSPLPLCLRCLPFKNVPRWPGKTRVRWGRGARRSVLQLHLGHRSLPGYSLSQSLPGHLLGGCQRLVHASGYMGIIWGDFSKHRPPLGSTPGDSKLLILEICSQSI